MDHRGGCAEPDKASGKEGKSAFVSLARRIYDKRDFVGAFGDI